MKKLLALALAVIMTLTMTVGLAEAVVTPEVTQGFTWDLTKLLEVIVTLIFGVIVYHLTPYLKDKRVQALVKTAYYAAEQLYNTGEIKDKLAYAEAWLKKKGVKVDTRALIEAFCGEVNEYREQLELEYLARAAYEYGYFDPEDDEEDFEDDEYDDEGWEDSETVDGGVQLVSDPESENGN